MNKFFDYLFHHQNLLLAVIWSYVGHFFSDETYLRVRFRLLMGKWPDLKNPKTFSEKLQWLKLHDRRPEYTMMVDKYAVKEYVAGIIGNEYVIPTLGVWNKPEDIEWDKLPDRFVLKTTNGGGSLGVVICKDKATLDKESAVKKLRSSMNSNGFRIQGEWPYKNVPHRIIAEQYIEPRPDLKDLPDYKFFCFDGVVKGLFVATERQNPNEDVKFDFFDAEYNHLPFRQGHDHAKVTPLKPENFELMKDIASKLSKGMPQARVDLYDLGDKVFFGEITMYHFGGLVPFEPEEWDKIFGDMIKLPGEKMGGVIIRQSTNVIEIEPIDLPDYKFFCFNGEPKFCQVISGRANQMCIDFFDVEWKHLSFHEPKIYPFSQIKHQKPAQFEEMLEAARKLAQEKIFCRIDFYQSNDRFLFGEITFYPTSGFGGFEPEEWDLKFGELIKLPKKE